MYFLDTCIFIHATNNSTKWFNKAQAILKEKWLTSKIVVEELEEIHKRRKSIYSNISSIDYEKLEGKKTEDFYTSCIKSALGGSKNDEYHLLELYNYLLKETKLKGTDILNKERISILKETIFPILTVIKIRCGNIVGLFNQNPLYYDDHVVPEVWDTSGKYLRNQLYKINGGTQNKGDLRIVTDATIYSHDKNISLNIVTSDGYLVHEATDIKKIIKNMESHHIKNKQIHSEIDITHIKDIIAGSNT